MTPPGLPPISADTRVCAVLGHPIAHSASPAMQNAGLTALGFDWRYLAFDVAPERLAEAVEGAKAMRYIGLNLTVPHKLIAVDLVEELDDQARGWGAVNTIRFEGRIAGGDWVPLGLLGDEEPQAIRTHGFNTDAAAITRALKEDVGFAVDGARVVLLGAGGAGRTAALKLTQDGVRELYLVNRSADKATALAREIAARFPKAHVAVGYPSGSVPVDLVLNATSLGLRPTDPSPLDGAQLSWERIDAAYDMIYRPAETRFLKDARQAGCRVSNGIGMLLYQGVDALEIWTGRPGPVEVMRRALEEHLYG